MLLAGCDTDKLSRTFGLTRDSPDEYTVTTRAPLSMPPEYSLRPPQPGASRPQEQTERQQAEEALAPQLTLGAQAPGSVSQGQTALTQQAGPAASSDIRRRVDQDAQSDNDSGFIDKLLYWRKPDPQGAQVDAQKEFATPEAKCGTRRKPQRRGDADHPAAQEGMVLRPFLLVVADAADDRGE